MAKESDLENMKKEYSKIQKKYALPGFDELNKEFNIEKNAELETDYLIREVRKSISDKLVGFMRFIESLLNPVNVPMFIFYITKNLRLEDKKKLTKVYKELSKNEVLLIEADTKFSERNEAEFIKKSYRLWKEIQEDILNILEVIKKNWDNEFEAESKGYFG